MSASEVLGFTLLIVSMAFLGSWPALLRLCSTSTELWGWVVTPMDQRFAYLDFAFSYVVSSSIPLAIALLEEEDRESISSQQWQLVLSAFLGGCLLSVGNMSMQWATTVFGAPLTTVVAIQASLTVLLGTSINYLLEPQMTGKPELLVAGVVAFLMAIALATRAHLLYGQGKDHMSEEGIELGEGVEFRTSYGSLDSGDSLESSDSLARMDKETVFVDDPAHIHDSATQASRRALALSIFGGCCFGFFSPAFNIAVNDPFQYGTPLSVPLANLWFSLAFTLSSVGGNIPLMYNPPKEFGFTKTSWVQYFRESNSGRKLAMVAGFLCGTANLLQFQGGNLVGFATADLVQAYPLVSTMWDVALFGEFRSAKGVVTLYLVAMYSMYMCGIGCLITSAIL